MPTLLTEKQRNFALDVFRDVTPSKAYLIHYKCKPSASRTLASRLLTNANVLAFLQELRQKAEDASVASVLERKQRLTEILRASVPDFQDEGGGIAVKKDMAKVGAVAEVTTRQKWNRKSMEPVVITNLKLHSPMQAIDLLNKMDKIYTEDERKPVEIVQSFIFVLPDGTRVAPASLALPNSHSATQNNE